MIIFHAKGEAHLMGYRIDTEKCNTYPGVSEKFFIEQNECGL
jgi:hypothetical protein